VKASIPRPFAEAVPLAGLTKYQRLAIRKRLPLQETLSPDLLKLAAKSARDEYTDGTVYQMLSRHEKNQSFKKA